MLKKATAATEAAHPLLLATLCPQCLKEIELLPGIEIPTLQLADDGRFACKNGHAYDTLPEEAAVEEPAISDETPPWELPDLETPPPKAPPLATIAPEAIPPVGVPVVEVPLPEAVAFEKPRGTSAPGDDGAPRELPGGDVIFTVRVSETHVTNLRAEAEVKEMTLKGYFDAWVDYCLSTGLYF